MTERIDFERIIREETLPARALARYIHDAWLPYDVLDVGCGPGIYTEALRACGVYATGVDNDERCPWWVVRQDITDPREWPGRHYQLVLCLEVLEHIPEEWSEQALCYLVAARSKMILFSAAIPGQGGEGHIHCRPKSYWVERFHAHGYWYDVDRTDALLAHIRTQPHMGWFTQNAMVLTRPEEAF